MSPQDSPPMPQALADTLHWPDAAREAAFQCWMQALPATLGLRTVSLRMASADASFRRYFRIDGTAGTYVIMDAPPQHEDCAPFVRIAALMHDAGMRVPTVLDWQREHGFLLLSDLGARTLLQAINQDDVATCRTQFLHAVEALLAWQRASRPDVLPPYDAALLQRELDLFPTWYLARHRGVAVEGTLQATLQQQFARIVEHNLASASVYVHRDFMPRNLMVADDTTDPRLGVLDFQDAVYGPISYDIASLLRDAFLSWNEDFVLDITVRYWEGARRAGLPVPDDFGTFYRAVEWMGLQRHLKVAGIFARLSLRDGKPQYLADTPRFIRYIHATCSRYGELTPLRRLIEDVEQLPQQHGFTIGRG